MQRIALTLLLIASFGCASVPPCGNERIVTPEDHSFCPHTDEKDYRSPERTDDLLGKLYWTYRYFAGWESVEDWPW